MKKLPNKAFHAGTYQLGYQWVELWLDPSSHDGSFDCFHGKPEHARITLGVADESFEVVLGTLFHEVFESLCCDMRLRYRNTDSYTEASDTYFFMMDHREFTELCARAAAFVNQCQKCLMTWHIRFHSND